MTGLEALNETVNKFADVILLAGHEPKNATNLTNVIDYLERMPQIRTLRKCVKALEIIKKKRVVCDLLTNPDVMDYKKYNSHCDKYDFIVPLTEDEFELLKEVLE